MKPSSFQNENTKFLVANGIPKSKFFRVVDAPGLVERELPSTSYDDLLLEQAKDESVKTTEPQKIIELYQHWLFIHSIVSAHRVAQLRAGYEQDKKVEITKARLKVLVNQEELPAPSIGYFNVDKPKQIKKGTYASLERLDDGDDNGVSPLAGYDWIIDEGRKTSNPLDHFRP